MNSLERDKLKRQVKDKIKTMTPAQAKSYLIGMCKVKGDMKVTKFLEGIRDQIKLW